MSGMTLFFVVLGAGVVSAKLLDLIEWLDAPRRAKPVKSACVAARRTFDGNECAAAELALERARLAA